MSMCLNSSLKIDLLPYGIGDKETSCAVELRENPYLPYVNCSSQSEMNFSIKILDSMDFPHKIGVVKIDVEGFEKNVLLGGHKFFTKSKIPYIVTEFPTGGGEEFLQKWNELGYNIHRDTFNGSQILPSQFVDTRGALEDLFLTRRT